jgi:hypothetical protein
VAKEPMHEIRCTYCSRKFEDKNERKAQQKFDEHVKKEHPEKLRK